MTESETRRGLVATGSIVVAVAWGLTTGGTSALDLAVLAALVVVAALAVAADRTAAVVLSLFTLALAVTGIGHDGWSLGALRVPVLVAVTGAVFSLAGRLGRDDRERVLDAIVLLGTVHAVVAVADASIGGASGSGGLLGSPNALGAFLAATVLLTMRRSDRWNGLWVVALMTQLAGMLATGSRLAIAVAGVAVGVHLLGRSRLARPVVAAGLAVAAVAAFTRMTADPFARTDLWRASLDRVGNAPWFGSGEQHRWLADPAPGVPGTPYAHNEPLQVAMEYGGPAAVVVVGTLAWALWPALRTRRDPWLLAAALTLLASGMVDVTMRSTPVLITTVALIAFLRPTTPNRSGQTTHVPAATDTPTGSQRWTPHAASMRDGAPR